MMTPEVGVLLAGAVMLGAGIGYISKWLPQWGVAIVCGVLIIVFGIFVFNVFNLLSSIDEDVIPLSAVRLALKFVGVFVLPILLALILRRDISLILCCSGVVFLLGSLFALPADLPPRGDRIASTGAQKRLVLHIIFDEFAGNSGIGQSFPDGNRLRSDVAQFFVKHNFRLYEWAFSTYPYTKMSIPSLLSFSNFPPKGIPPQPYAWFKKLHSEGFQIVYIGNEYLPLCRDKAIVELTRRCVLYPALDLRTVHDTQLPFWHKASVIFELSLLNIPYVNTLITRFRIASEAHNEVDVFKSLAPLADVRTALLNGRGDLAVIVHVLLPHSPMLYDANCSPHLDQLSMDGTSWPGLERQAYQRAYAGQVRCTLKQMDAILHIVDRNWPDATVIVHGDHGLRLHPFASDREDIRLRHASLFAVRARDVSPGIVSQEHNMQMLFARYAGNAHISDSRILYGDNENEPNQSQIYPH